MPDTPNSKSSYVNFKDLLKPKSEGAEKLNQPTPTLQSKPHGQIPKAREPYVGTYKETPSPSTTSTNIPIKRSKIDSNYDILPKELLKPKEPSYAKLQLKHPSEKENQISKETPRGKFAGMMEELKEKVKPIQQKQSNWQEATKPTSPSKKSAKVKLSEHRTNTGDRNSPGR